MLGVFGCIEHTTLSKGVIDCSAVVEPIVKHRLGDGRRLGSFCFFSLARCFRHLIWVSGACVYLFVHII